MRRLSLVCALMCAHFIMTLAAFAGGTNTTQVVNDPDADQEPALAATTINGQTRLTAAWMTIYKFSSDPRQGKIRVSSSLGLNAWSEPQVLERFPGGFAGDPFIAVNPANPAEVYLVSEAREGRVRRYSADKSDDFGGQNEIVLWKSTNGGASFRSGAVCIETVCAANIEDSAGHVQYKPDKPSITIASDGTIYVAHVSIAVGPHSGAPAELHVHRKSVGDAAFSLIKIPHETSSVHSPIVMVNPAHSRIFVAWLRPADHKIVMAFADPADWPASGEASPFRHEDIEEIDSGTLIGPGNRLEGNCSAIATSMLMGRYNAARNTIGLVWHAREAMAPGSSADLRPQTEIHFASYDAATTSFVKQGFIGGSGGDTDHRWNPAIDADEAGNYLVTYYDSGGTANAIAAAAKYHFRAALVDWMGDPVGNPSIAVDPMESDVRVYKLRGAGEYQDVRWIGGRWYAAFIGVTDNGDCSVAQCGDECPYVRGDAYVTEVSPASIEPCRWQVAINTTQIVPAEGGRRTISFSSNPFGCAQWRSARMDPAWATLEATPTTPGGAATFQTVIPPNTEDAARTATVQVLGDNNVVLGTVSIIQAGAACNSNRTFNVRAGRCEQVEDPTYEVRRNTRVVISPQMVSLDGATILQDKDDPSRDLFQFKWSGDGIGSRNYEGRDVSVTADREKNLRVTVTRILDNTCETIPVRIVPMEPACETVCEMASCRKKRAVRVSGVPVQTVSFTPSDSFVLQPPGDEPAVAYEWHRTVAAGADEVFATSREVAVTPAGDTQYRVVVQYGKEAEESEFLYAVDESTPEGPSITPAVKVIEAGREAQFDVLLPPGFTATSYEWREGDPTTTNATVAGTGPRLIRSNVQYDTTFWCNVTGTDGRIYRTNVAHLVVTCTPSLSGILRTNPSSGYVSRMDRPFVWTTISGKQLSLRWYRNMPGETARTLFHIYGTSTWVSPTDPITEYTLDAWDVCGNSAALGPVSVYLCLPTIDRQPADTVAPPQSPVVLNLEASPAIAGQEIKVFWFGGGDPYQQNPLHEGPVFATTSSAAGMSQTYYATVVATNACGGVPRGIRSANVTVTSCTPPQVSVSPSAPSIRAGTSLTLTVSATSTPLTYQWYVGAPGNTASPIEGATDSYVTVRPLTNTSYWVRVTSDGVCTTDSAEIRVNVCTDPVITAQPAPATIVPGATATLSVATSAAGVTYQWYDAGTADPIPGAASATLSVSPTVDTSYYVRIKRDACTVQSNTVRVTVCALTANLTGGKDTAYQEWVTLTVTPSNARVPTANAHYTWYKGTGANATVFNSGTGMTQRSDNPATTTQYWVRVNDGTCTYDSNVVTVNVCVPTITLQPQGTLIQPNQTATLSVSTTNIAGQTFQWYIGQPGDTSQPAPGTSATSATYTTPALASTTSYWVRVSGPCGAVRNSEAAIVSVCAPATVSSVTPTRTIKARTATILQVSATGSNLTYQWYAGTPGTTTNPIEGATADSVTVSPTTTTTYWARIWTDGLCAKDSPAILVDVCTDPLISTHPSPVTIFIGWPATLSVASPTNGVTYQWYDANTADPIAGATNPTLVVTPAADARYYARIKRNACTVQSNTAQVTVCALTVNLTGGKNTTYQEWVTLTATPANSRVPSANAHYTWYKGTGANAIVFNSGTGMTQRSDNPATTTQYWVRVSDGTCTHDSNVVTVNVCVPTIATQPQGTLIQPNQTATLSVSTATIAGQTYRWYIGARGDTSQPAPGTSATSSTYITPALTSTTTYWVRVTGPCGAIADSAVATVSVCTPATIGSVTPTRYVKAGTTTWHQVYATGSNLTYQWYIGSPGNTTNPIPDATTNSIGVTPTTTTTYWARIWTDGLCTKDSSAMIVDVCTNPVVTTQPASTSVKSGQSATLSVATSTAGVTYQWYSGSGTLINGATGSSLTVTPTTDTAYYCQLTKNACSINSATATVKVCTLTAAISGGTNATSGQNVLLTASATNLRVTADAATYTWYRGTGPSATVLASGVGLRQRYVSTTTTTDYWLRITVGTCTADSNTTRVNVCIPTITAHPQGANITRGQSVTLSVSATAASSYQWYVGSAGDTSQPVAGATTASMTVTPTATTTYWARVTGCSSVDSIAATIDVCQPPTITAGPSENGVRSPGAWAAIWVTASGANLGYQWYIGQSGDTSMPITAATTDRYDFIAQDSRYYWVRITGSCGTVNSATVLHSVNPQIVQHPANTTVPPNATVTLSVSATGTYLAYQWYRGNTFDVSNPVSGATSSSFTTPPVTGTTNYWCRVTSATQGVANSYHATVGLCTGPSITQFRAQYQYLNYWWISVTMAEADIGNVAYHWYTGVPGNVSQSVYKGEANGYKQVLATAQQTWWCRVWYNDQSCYTDTNGATIYPVE